MPELTMQSPIVTPTAPTSETPTLTTATAVADPLVSADLLVEDVSIDGMCGVY